MHVLMYSACHVVQMALFGEKVVSLMQASGTRCLQAHLVSATIACVAEQCFKSLQTDHTTSFLAHASADIVHCDSLHFCGDLSSLTPQERTPGALLQHVQLLVLSGDLGTEKSSRAKQGQTGLMYYCPRDENLAIRGILPEPDT